MLFVIMTPFWPYLDTIFSTATITWGVFRSLFVIIDIGANYTDLQPARGSRILWL